MNLGEILDRSFQVYRGKFLVFAGIAALPALAMFVVHSVDITCMHVNSLVHPFRQSGFIVWNFLVSLGYSHISGFLNLLVMPAQVYIASAILHDEKSTINQAFRSVAARWKVFLWIAFLKMLVQLLIPEVLTAGLVLVVAFFADRAGAFNGGGGESIAIVALGLCVIAGCILHLLAVTAFSLAIPICTFEQIMGKKALRRSWILTRGTRLRILFAWLLVFISNYAGMYGIQVVFRWIVIDLFRELNLGMISQAVYSVVVQFLFAAVIALILPLIPIFLTLFYYDQRIRKEGYDIERMMEIAGMNGPATLLVDEAPAALAATEESLG
jgi:hypothetical protein